MAKQNKQAQRIQYLDRQHSQYADVNQTPNEADEMMVSLGHPFAVDFKSFLIVFSGLKYAAGFGERYIAFRDETHFAKMKCPGLRVDDDPVRHGRADDFEKVWAQFGDAYPTYPGNWEGYKKYITKCGELQWPEVCGPSFECEFDIQTFDYRLIGDLFKLMKGRISIGRAYGPNGRQSEKEAFRFRVGRYDNITGKEALLILALIHRRMKRWILPPRTETDNIMDAMPVELPQKKWMLANVDKVIVTDHHVQIPLMPLDDTVPSRVLRQNTAEAIIRLVEDGYLWEPSARQWCEQFLRPEVFRKFDRKFKKAKVAV